MRTARLSRTCHAAVTRILLVVFFTSGAAAATQASAAANSIGINFVGGSQVGVGGSSGGGAVNSMQLSEFAGVVPQAFWNNAGIGGQANNSVNESGTLAAGTLTDSSGTPVPALMCTWNAQNTFSTYVADNAGSFRMMKGYLDSSGVSGPYASSTTTVTIANLPSSYVTSGYDVILYFDGLINVATTQDRVGRYRVFDGPTNSGTMLGEIFGRDPAGVDFSGNYIQASGTSIASVSAGNYVRFSGLHASTITVDAFGSADTVPRAPINGIQIVAIPEPCAAALAALGLVAGASVFPRRNRE